MYDTIITPLALMVLEEDSIARAFDVIVLCFWFMDCVVSFFTATFVEGHLATDFRTIARQYLKSWMIPDAVMVLSEVTLLLFSSSRAGLAVLRPLKVIRCL